MNQPRSVQEIAWPDGICFGCGPRNDKGLHIQSYVDGDDLVCDWHPEPHHQAFPGILNGGIIGSLLDCHSNAAAWWVLCEKGASPGQTVTAEYTVRLAAPTPVDRPLRIVARVVETSGRKARVEARIEADGKVTATCEGTFVKVRPGAGDL